MIVEILCIVLLYLGYIDVFGNHPNDEDENWLGYGVQDLLD